jgi:hypothetical protein
MLPNLNKHHHRAKQCKLGSFFKVVVSAKDVETVREAFLHCQSLIKISLSAKSTSDLRAAN